MNIGVFCLYTKEFDGVAEITIPAWRRYCDRHGYELTVHRGGYHERSRKIGFQKTTLALQLLQGTDALLVVDCDVLVTNHTVKLESLLDKEHSMFATHDANGFNAGVYLIKNVGQSRVFLFNASIMGEISSVLGEQDAMRDLFKTGRYEGFCKVLPQSALNSYLYEEYGSRRRHEEGQWHPGDFLLHAPGRSNERRLQIFRLVEGEIIE